MISDLDGSSKVKVDNYRMNEPFEWYEGHTEVCTHPKFNEFKCQSQFGPPLRSDVMKFELDFYFYDWGMVEKYIIPDINASMSRTSTMVEESTIQDNNLSMINVYTRINDTNSYFRAIATCYWSIFCYQGE